VTDADGSRRQVSPDRVFTARAPRRRSARRRPAAAVVAGLLLLAGGGWGAVRSAPATPSVTTVEPSHPAPGAATSAAPGDGTGAPPVAASRPPEPPAAAPPPAAASAVVVPGPDARPRGRIVCRTTAERCGAVTQAAARLSRHYGWRALGWDVVVAAPVDDWLTGQADADRRRITIFPRDGMDGDALAHVLAHEVGHAVDAVHTTPERRAAYVAARGLPADAPERVPPPHDHDSVREDFAETFAWWALGIEHRSTLAPPPADPAEVAPFFLRLSDSRAAP
jgi:hypothetical protein